MRFTLTILGIAFAFGLTMGLTTEQAVAPGASAGLIEDGLGQLGDLVEVPTGSASGVREAIVNVINFALTFLALIAVLTVIVAGFFLILGMGSENSSQRARKIIIYTIIGLLVIFFVRVIVGFFIVELPAIFS